MGSLQPISQIFSGSGQDNCLLTFSDLCVHTCARRICIHTFPEIVQVVLLSSVGFAEHVGMGYEA